MNVNPNHVEVFDEVARRVAHMGMVSGLRPCMTWRPEDPQASPHVVVSLCDDEDAYRAWQPNGMAVHVPNAIAFVMCEAAEDVLWRALEVELARLTCFELDKLGPA